MVNCLFNADYRGVRGVVVRHTPDKLVFENPGDIRTGIEQMRLGGVSDPRNGLVMKMFSLIDVGERAGTGVPDVFATWANAGLPEPRIEENFGEADRTILTLMLEADAKPDNNEQITDDYEQINSAQRFPQNGWKPFEECKGRRDALARIRWEESASPSKMFRRKHKAVMHR